MKTRRKSARSAYSHALRYESLEDRRMLAVTTEITGPVGDQTLRVIGDAESDVVQLSIENDELNFEVVGPVAPSLASSALAGDFNGDSTVDGADYTVWRDTFGSLTDLRADGNGDSVVDKSDYDVWKNSVGQSIAAPPPTLTPVSTAGVSRVIVDLGGGNDRLIIGGSQPFDLTVLNGGNPVDFEVLASVEQTDFAQELLTVSPAATMPVGGDISIASAVFLTRTTSITGNAIAFGSTIDAADDGLMGVSNSGLTVQHAGELSFGGGVGAQGSLIAGVADPEGLSFLAASSPVSSQVLFGVATPSAAVVTVGDQTYNAPVLLEHDTVLTSIAGSVMFNDTVDAETAGVQGLTVDFADTLEFNEQVGNAEALEFLTVNGGDQTKLNVADPMVAVQTVNDQTYNAPVLLQEDTQLTSTMGSVFFNDFVDAMDNGVDGTSDHGLTVNFAGTLEAIAEIGGDNQSVPAMMSDPDGLEFFTANGGGEVRLNVPDPLVAVRTVNDQAYNAPVVLFQDIVLNSTAGSVVFGDTIDGADFPSIVGLTVNFDDTLEIGGRIGSDRALRFLSVNGGDQVLLNVADAGIAIQTTGSQTYNAPVVLGQDTELDSDVGVIAFEETVDAALVGAQGLTVNSIGTIEFNGRVGSDAALEFLTVNAFLPVLLNGVDIETVGNQTFNVPVFLEQDTELTSTAGSIFFDNSVNAQVAGDQGLTVNFDGVLEINDQIGNAGILEFLTANGGDLIRLDVATLSFAVQTVNDQTYNAPVLLEEDTRLISTAGSVEFGGTVDAQIAGLQGLAVDFDNTLEINAPIGSVEALAFLIANGGDQVKLNVAAPAVTVQTVNDQTYNAPVLLLEDTVLTSTMGSVAFNDFVDAMDNGVGGTSDFGLTVDFADTLEVNAEIGGDNQPIPGMMSDPDGLEFFTANSGGEIQLNVATPAIAVMTVNDQTYYAPVLLEEDTLLISTVGSVVFNDTVDAALAGVQGLTVNFDGTLGINGRVGNVGALEFLTANGGNEVLLNVATAGVDIETVGNQTYNAPVLLEEDTVLSSTAGSIFFNDTVDAQIPGVQSLTTNFFETLEFNDRVGSVQALGSLTANGGDEVLLDVATGGVDVETVGDQTYNAPVSLGQDTVLTSTGGSVIFDDTVNALAAGGQSLTVNFAEVLRVDGQIGNAEALEFLTANDFGVGQVQLNVATGPVSVQTTGNQLYNAPTLLLQDTRLNSSSGAIRFDDLVDAANNLVNGPSDFGLVVEAPLTLANGDPRGGEIFLAPVGSGGQLGSDTNGLQFVQVNLGLDSLVVDVPITTTRDIDLLVANGSLILGDEGRLLTNGDGPSDGAGVVTLEAGNDVVIDPAAPPHGAGRGNGMDEAFATIFAEERLTIRADTDGDVGGATVSTTTPTPELTDAFGILFAPIVEIEAGDENDILSVQAERFGAGNEVSIDTFGGDDDITVVFSDRFELDAASLIIEAGDDPAGFDTVTNDYRKDTSGRTTGATYTTLFSEVAGDVMPVIDGEDVAYDGLNLGVYAANGVERHEFEAGVGVGPDLVGIQTTPDLVTPANLAEPNFLRLEQQITVDDIGEMGSGFFVNNVEGLDLDGSEVRDAITNNSSVPAKIDGGEGNDVLLGRQVGVANPNGPIDVIISGPGVTNTPGGPVIFDPSGIGDARRGDISAGGDGQDFILSDVQIFIDPNVAFGRDALYAEFVIDTAGESDIVSGDLINAALGEVNHGAQSGSDDEVRALTGMFLDGGGEKDFFMWLFVNPMVANQENLDLLARDAFFGSTDGVKVGLLEQVLGDETLTDEQLAVVLAEYNIEVRAR